MQESKGAIGRAVSWAGGKLRQTLIWIGVVMIAYVAGYATRYVETLGAQEELQRVRQTSQTEISRLQEQVRLARLHGQVGLLLLEVEQSNFGKARALSTRFFEDLLQELQSLPEGDSRQRLEKLRQRRDEVTTDLAVSSAEVGKKLRQMYGELAFISGLKSE